MLAYILKKSRRQQLLWFPEKGGEVFPRLQHIWDRATESCPPDPHRSSWSACANRGRDTRFNQGIRDNAQEPGMFVEEDVPVNFKRKSVFGIFVSPHINKADIDGMQSSDGSGSH